MKRSADRIGSQYIFDGVPIESPEVLQQDRILKGYHKHDLVIIKIHQDAESLERETHIFQLLGRDPPYAVLYHSPRLLRL